MRAPEDATPEQQPGAASRLTRAFVAAIVVFASAMTGYAGSHIWPLPTLSGPTTHLVETGSTSIAGPELRQVEPPPSAQASNSITATATAPSPTTQFEAQGSSAGQAGADGRRAPTTNTTSSKVERPAASRRWAPSATSSRMVRKQSTGGAKPSVVEFAPNPRPNQALRDFMAAPAGN